jgi:prevent-host-death family protein
MKRIVGARELKTRLGTYLRAVRDGATIVVTERGTAVAELRPLPSAEDPAEAWRTELAAVGVLTKGSGGPIARFRPASVKGEPVSRTLSRMREDRF